MGVTVFLAVLLASQPAWVLARETYRLPEGMRLTVQQGTFQAYSLEEFKLLLKMDVDLESFTKQIPKYIKLQENLTKLNVNINKQLELAQNTIKVLYGERDRLTKKWTEENRLRHLAENKPSIMTWLGWGSAAAMGIVATVLAVILVVKKNG
jgi:hypothetical protein